MHASVLAHHALDNFSVRERLHTVVVVVFGSVAVSAVGGVVATVNVMTVVEVVQERNILEGNREAAFLGLLYDTQQLQQLCWQQWPTQFQAIIEVFRTCAVAVVAVAKGCYCALASSAVVVGRTKH